MTSSIYSHHQYGNSDFSPGYESMTSCDKPTVDHLKNVFEVESLAIPDNTNGGDTAAQRKLRPPVNSTRQQQKQHPADLATEIGSSLVAEVRRLRCQVKELEATWASEQQEHEHAVRQRLQLEKQQDGMKDEIWNLELAKQELEEHLETTNTKLSRMSAECTRLEKQLEQIHNKSAEQCRTEQETNNAARQLEQHRLTLVKELRALKKENAHLHQQLQTATTETNLWKNKVALSTDNKNQASSSPPPKSALPPDPQPSSRTDEPTTTPPGSPPQQHAIAQQQQQHHHHHLEKETLQQSLAHAQEIISSLRTTLHKEKLDGIETKKLLAESQETIEDLRRDSMTNQSHRRKQHRRYRARQEKRNSMTHVAESGESDDNNGEHTADKEESDNGGGSGIEGKHMQNSLFSELQSSGINTNTNTNNNSNSTTIKNGEAQTDKLNKINVETQTDEPITVVTVDAVVQCSSNVDEPLLSSRSAQQQQQRVTQRHNYLEPIKRALHETSTTLLNRKQRSNTATTVRPVATISTPPTLSSAEHPPKQQQKNSPHVEFAPTTIGSLGKSKLLEYASKYNDTLPKSPSRASNTVTSPPPTPIPSFSIATPRGSTVTVQDRNSSKDTVFPITSVSDSLTTKRQRRPSRTTAVNKLNTLNEMEATAAGLRNGAGSDHENVTIDPAIVEAVTQTMIGSWMWKHTRYYVRGKNGISHRKGHMRFVWIHPYTRTLYWSAKPPGIDHDETKSKRAFIKDVWSVPCTENPCSSVPSNLLIRTSVRDLMLHAQTMDQHHQWITALCYLLGRPGLVVEESDHHVVARMSSLNNNNSSSSCGVSTLSGSNTLSTYSTAFLNSSIFQGSSSSTSSPQDSIFSDADDDDDDEDFVNIRQCCNGKHDVSTLARK
ncbi:meiotic cell cortex C-terminal pleckstrin homology-domain-containing protein [Zychaea mexicana]|uniref:uncharacterized protein n=1 Tax=Zychaea mexicana TaxID=64656 RepID=UPI0022FE3975|nr:uncharacterized protein BDB00DRAFT_936108 [Zychaea mexicana]KAI9497659.1 meiotic cell cortex C-terminal pleckstrin homology-domain-containing protein [Zychaea mexicana]